VGDVKQEGRDVYVFLGTGSLLLQLAEQFGAIRMGSSPGLALAGGYPVDEVDAVPASTPCGDPP
jgi:hypothetical protein